MTKIVVPVMPRSLEDLEKIDVARYALADRIEWRADFLVLDEILKVAPRFFERFQGKEILFTLRTAKEGGQLKVADTIYSYILNRIAEDFPQALLDVEYFSYPTILAELANYKNRIVLSYHNFECLPGDLGVKLQQMANEKTAFVKVAVNPRTSAEVLAFMQYSRAFSDSFNVPLIAVAMGKKGRATRILSNLTGSTWTFANLAGESSELGQLTLEQTRMILDILAS